MDRDLLADLKQTRPYPTIAQEVYISLLRTAAVAARAFEEFLKPHGITGTQYNVLRILRGAGPEGLCRGEIRDRMVASVPDVTRLLDRLESTGLVVRSRSATDRRRMTTRITRAGLALLRQLDAPIVEAHKKHLRHMAPARMQALLELLAEVRRGS